MDREIAAKYIGENFKPSDRLAVVLLNKRTGAVTQRITTAERIGAPEFQAWLRHKNAQKHEIYISMNALHASATGRTKADIADVRHLYLDFDENGTEAVEKLLARQDLPRPNYRISSSPGKWQVVWKVEEFAPEQAEQLQRWLARETGADPAATDSARVLRLPGYYNHKYQKPHFVSAETLSNGIYRSQDFPAPDRLPDGVAANRAGGRLMFTKGRISQSERDWAYAKRALARGDPEAFVITAIATWRRYDKHNPQYYAEHTVRKASESLNAERGVSTVTEQPEQSR
jgi:hypothetical protein